MAINWAIRRVTQISQNTRLMPSTLSSVQAINSKFSHQKPNLYTEKEAHNAQANIELVWIPSHIGVKGNEIADQLTFQATFYATVDINSHMKWNEIDKMINTYSPISRIYGWKTGKLTNQHFIILTFLQTLRPVIQRRNAICACNYHSAGYTLGRH